MRLTQRDFKDRKVRSHILLESAFDDFDMRDELRHEFRVCFTEYLSKGFFKLSSDRIESSYGSGARRDRTKFLNESGIIEAIGDYCGGRCQKYRFRLEGVIDSHDCADSTRNKVSGRGYAERGWRHVEDEFVAVIVMPATFLLLRSLLWVQACKKFHWDIAIDHFGLTSWGRATVDSLSAFVLPELSREEVDALAKNNPSSWWWRRYLNGLHQRASQCVQRARGRAYHCLSSCPKPIRRLIRVRMQGGEVDDSVTVDLHASYWVLLTSELWDDNERSRLIELLQSRRFYDTLNALLPANQRYDDSAQLKIETQKQCLFWYEQTRLDARPIWQAMLDNFPGLAQFILRLREIHGVSGLSDWLTKRESSLFVDNALLECHRQGIPAITLHDAIMTAKSCASRVREIIETLAESFLGFKPALKVA